MVFEYILKKHNLDPATDMNIDQSIDFGSTAAAFSGGQGDFTVEFEPGASTLEKEGKGYVVASLGVDSGYVPYTAYSAKQSYLNAHPEIIQGFTNALQKGMDYVQSHTPAEIAKVIAPQFAETDLEDITTIVTRYYELPWLPALEEAGLAIHYTRQGCRELLNVLTSLGLKGKLVTVPNHRSFRYSDREALLDRAGQFLLEPCPREKLWKILEPFHRQEADGSLVCEYAFLSQLLVWAPVNFEEETNL